MMDIRRSADRGAFNFGWLDTRHTFSFSDYYDPRYMGFRTLRVINEDIVTPGSGFPTHPHRDMEIITYVLGGAVQHRDSMGNGSVIKPGEVQRMSAGTGVTHSEFNASKDEPLHLLQIWILPEQSGLQPSYEQKAFSDADRRNHLRVVASRDGRDGSVVVHQDATLLASLLDPDVQLVHPLASGRGAWVQVARGRVRVNGQTLDAGDGACIVDEPDVKFEGLENAELLVFDLGQP